MKTLTYICLLSSLIAHTSFGAVALPKGSFPIKENDQAVAKAIKDKKLVAYILHNPKSTCSFADEALEDFLKIIGKKCTIIEISSKDKTRETFCPKEVKAAFIISRYTPHLVIVNPCDGSIVFNALYEDHKKDPKKLSREIKKAISEGTKKVAEDAKKS